MRVCGEIKQSKIGREIERNGGKKNKSKIAIQDKYQEKTSCKIDYRCES
jgi:hypothetical protein